MSKTMYLDKKEIPDKGKGNLNQYFLMGIDFSDVIILRTSLQLLVDKMKSKADFYPEERELYRKVLRLHSTLKPE